MERKIVIYKRYLKRPLDILLSAIALVVLSPVMLIVAVIIRFKLGSPVIFSQLRPGKDEKIFRMYKFRTMTDEMDEYGELLPDTMRLTRFGRILRSTSLDELPELWNILIGDMSIIGPRPLLTKYLPLYNCEQKTRHNVRPGLTGFAQINGRNSITWTERFKYDVVYVENITFMMDFIILISTVRKVIKREDINSSSDSTMAAFDGNN